MERSPQHAVKIVLIRENVEELIRRTGKHWLENVSKENCYVFYLMVLNLFWGIEEIYVTAKDALLEDNERVLQNRLLEKCKEMYPEWEEQLRKVQNVHEKQISDLESKLKSAEDRIRGLEQEIEDMRKANEFNKYAAAASPIIERIETTYGKVKEALNETYDQQMMYRTIILAT